MGFIIAPYDVVFIISTALNICFSSHAVISNLLVRKMGHKRILCVGKKGNKCRCGRVRSHAVRKTLTMVKVHPSAPSPYIDMIASTKGTK